LIVKENYSRGFKILLVFSGLVCGQKKIIPQTLESPDKPQEEFVSRIVVELSFPFHGILQFKKKIPWEGEFTLRSGP
jgi:hypothetical protein